MEHCTDAQNRARNHCFVCVCTIKSTVFNDSVLCCAEGLLQGAKCLQLLSLSLSRSIGKLSYKAVRYFFIK